MFTMTGQNLWGQSPNPFEIKSRTLIDSNEILFDNNSVLQSDFPAQDTSGAYRVRINTPGKAITIIPTPDSPVDTSLSHLQSPASEDTDPTLFSGSDVSVPPESSAVRKSSDEGFQLKNFYTPYELEGSGISWWYYIYDLVLLLILLGAFLYDKKIFPPIRKAFIHENFLRFLYRDTYIRKPGLFIYLNLIFLLSLGFVIYRTAQYYYQASTFQDYLIIQGVIILLFMIKHTALYLLSRLVDKPYEVKFYQYWMILSAGLCGLWMIPMVLMISVLPFKFLPIALILTGISIILLFMYRHFKAMLQAKYFLYKHFFQIILYFCAIEIVPVVLLADILVHY